MHAVRQEATQVTAIPNALPDITRPDVGIVLVSEWSLDTAERQRAVMDAAMAQWQHLLWPEGLLSHHCFASTDATTVLHFSQWTSEDAHSDFVRTDRPEYVRGVDEAVPGIVRHGVVRYRWYRTFGPQPDAAPRIPGCIIVVNIGADGPQRQRQWVDAVLEALQGEEQPHAELISAHFHLSTDGTRVLNYAIWTNEDAHREALEDSSAEGIAQAESPEWLPVRNYPGITQMGFKRYHLHRGLTSPLTLDAAHKRDPDQ